MKKILLLLPILLLMFAGCSDDNDSNGGGTSQETLNKVDDAFYKEYIKYVTDKEEPVSEQVESNIKLLMQNITGRGSMPASVGIGEVNQVVVASAIGHKVASDFSSQRADAGAKKLITYSLLNEDKNSFIQAVTAGLMNGTTGTSVLKSTSLYQQNQLAISKLTNKHIELFKQNNEEVNDNGIVNIAYLYSSLTGYFNMLKISSLPTDDTQVEKVVNVVFEQCKQYSTANQSDNEGESENETNTDSSDNDSENGNDDEGNTGGYQFPDPSDKNVLATYNADTTTFSVMAILTCGSNNPYGDDMAKFMNGIGQVFNPSYEFEMPSQSSN